ncbi:glycosyltransferase family 2 protein [Acinetobacter lwoffii]|uniref:glycosyltransferase family 2 protein n=1 Tax=Acinetobacter lwoffii TaxID=28090 RepID=UPI0021CD9945|nr:glycosyltransferase family 2 protein [Acinetobacter lwoffii]MCU4614792.1 glycosyltransferase family 2 protein [Acinetobacter lwoffii]
MGVSVGISIYNAERYIELAIKSVLQQTYSNIELILIDDGSIDQSVEIARKYERLDSRVRVIADGQNKKLPYRLNQLIKESKYNLIARMDADDIMHPDRLQKQLEIIEKFSCDVVATSYYTIDAENKVKSFREINKETITIDDLSLGNYYICHPSILAKKNWYLRNPYDSRYERAEDYELWVRAVLKKDFKIKIMNTPLMFYREDGSFSRAKQIKTYKTTYSIFWDNKKKMSFKNFFTAISRNFFKKIILYFLLNTYTAPFFLKRREKFNLSKPQNFANAQEIIDFIVNKK